MLVFVHGFLGSHLQWSELVKNLKQDYRLLFIDLPGHGAHKKNTTEYQISDISKSIHHIILEHHIEKAHFIGHSMGGYIASSYSTLFPSFTASLTLINSIAGPDSEQRKIERERSILLIKKLKRAFVSMAITNLFTITERLEYTDIIEHMKSQGHDLTQQTIIHAILAMRNRHGSFSQLKSCSFPVLYIYSPDDAIVPETGVHKEAQLLNCQAVPLDAGHMSILTHPAAIASILEEKLGAIL